MHTPSRGTRLAYSLALLSFAILPLSASIFRVQAWYTVGTLVISAILLVALLFGIHRLGTVLFRSGSLDHPPASGLSASMRILGVLVMWASLTLLAVRLSVVSSSLRNIYSVLGMFSADAPWWKFGAAGWVTYELGRLLAFEKAVRTRIL